MSYLDPAKGKTATQGVRLGAKACARCIAVRIQVQGLGWRVPRTAHKHQTGPRSSIRTSMPAQTGKRGAAMTPDPVQTWKSLLPGAAQ